MGAFLETSEAVVSMEAGGTTTASNLPGAVVPPADDTARRDASDEGDGVSVRVSLPRGGCGGSADKSSAGPQLSDTAQGLREGASCGTTDDAAFLEGASSQQEHGEGSFRRLEQLDPNELSFDSFKNGMLLLLRIYPAIMSLCFALVMALVHLTDFIQLVLLNDQLPDTQVTVSPTPFRKCLLLILSTLPMVEGQALLLTVFMGCVLDIWADGTWLDTFTGIPYLARQSFFHLGILYIPWGVLCLSCFQGLDTATYNYEISVLICLFIIVISYIILFMWDASNETALLLSPQSSSKATARTKLQNLWNLILLRTAQRYTWLSSLLWRLSLPALGKTVSEAEAEMCHLELNATAEFSCPCTGKLVELRRCLTHQGVKAMLRGNLEPSGHPSEAASPAPPGSLPEQPHDNPSSSAVPWEKLLCETGRDWLFYWLTFVGLVGFVASSLHGLPLSPGANAAVAVLCLLSAPGFLLLLKWRHDCAVRKESRGPVYTSVVAVPNPWFRVFLCLAEFSVCIVLPTVYYLIRIVADGESAYIILVVCLMCYIPVASVSILLRTDKIMMWQGTSGIGAWHLRKENETVLHRRGLTRTRIYSGKVRNFFVFFSWGYVFLLTLIVMLAVFFDAPLFGDSEPWNLSEMPDGGQPNGSATAAADASADRLAPSSSRSPVCSVNGHIGGLSVLDYLYLADLSYVSDQQSVQPRLDAYFGNGTVRSVDFVQQGVATGKINLFEFPDLDALVVAARGTHTWLDLMTNICMYIEVTFVQVVRTYIPFATSWDYTYPDVIWILSSLFRNGGAFNPRGLASRQDVGLEDYLQEVKAQYPDRDLVVTGHSLGGGSAMVAAARLKVHAVAFSAPNALLAHKKFQVSRADLEEFNVNVIPDRDIVPEVDIPSSRAQHFHCHAPGNPFATSLECHLTRRIACELQALCGHEGRPRILECDDVPMMSAA